MLELEPALRLYFAELGTREGAMRAIETLRVWARAHREAGAASVRSQLDGEGQFPERDHITMLVGQLYGRIYQAVEEWCDVAETEIGRWRDLDDPGPDARIRDLAEARLALASNESRQT